MVFETTYYRPWSRVKNRRRTFRAAGGAESTAAVFLLLFWLLLHLNNYIPGTRAASLLEA